MSSDLQATTGTAAAILRELPSVEVDADGVVSLRGYSNVTILVDGKPSAQLSGAAAADALLQLSANDIEKIEIITNPPAQFKANGSAGIINIITKKRHEMGPSGTAQASAGNNGRYVLNFNSGYAGKQLGLAGGLGLRQDERQRLITDNRAAIAPGTNSVAISQEDLAEHVRRSTPSIKAQIDYSFNDHQSGGVAFSERERSGGRHFDQFDESGLPDEPPTSISNRYSNGHEWRLDDGEDVHFEQKLRQPDETLSFDLQRSSVRERERYAYTNIYTLPVVSPSYDDLRLNQALVTTEFSADYVLPLSNGRSFKLGYDFEQDNSAFDNSGDNINALTGQAIVNPEITNDFHYLQQIHSVYASYLESMRMWTVLAGLRLEETITGFPQTAQSADSTHSYARAYPNIRVERPLTGASTLWASISRRVTRPDPEALNPFIDSQDTQNLRSGNPNLRPQDTQSFELGDKFESKNLNFGLTGYLRRNRNSVTEVTQVVNTQVVLITKANLPRDTSEGLEFTADGHFAPSLSYALSANLFHDQIDATALGAPGVKATTGINAKVSFDYHPTAADTAQISFSRSDRRLTPQGYVSGINLVNVGYKRQFGAGWAGLLTVSDLFNGQVFRRFVGTPTLTDSYQRQQTGRIAYVGVTYTFGAGKKSKAGFEYDP
ncbi:MAG TPA: outer membrane beta-barrel family protein [Steroidobacteraceae bacterium]|nr:outer membrane beta-barrel family protein [Steroidobacteraceae bacterium]